VPPGCGFRGPSELHSYCVARHDSSSNALRMPQFSDCLLAHFGERDAKLDGQAQTKKKTARSSTQDKHQMTVGTRPRGLTHRMTTHRDSRAHCARCTIISADTHLDSSGGQSPGRVCGGDELMDNGKLLFRPGHQLKRSSGRRSMETLARSDAIGLRRIAAN